MKTMRIAFIAAITAMATPAAAQWVYIPNPAPSVDMIERQRAQNAADMARLEQSRALAAQQQQARANQELANQQMARNLGIVPAYPSRPF